MIKVEGRKNDLGGGMIVSRILPSRQKRFVGPFCFLDHMGPVLIKPHQSTDVRPHPHIGLSTLTYLFEGRLLHRDSLGSVAEIGPGGVNWMTAGSGISHSERAFAEDQKQERTLHGLQFWIALPDGKEDVPPDFSHYDESVIPKLEKRELTLKLIAGEAFGLKSPVRCSSPLILAEIRAKQNFEFSFEVPGFELALFVVRGSATATTPGAKTATGANHEAAGVKVTESVTENVTENVTVNSDQILICNQNEALNVRFESGCHAVLFGGESLSTPRLMWWNLVSSSQEKINAAKAAWSSGAFPMVPGEIEFIPLPNS